MIIKVNSIDDCKICDNFLTLLIQDERKYDTTIDEKFVVKDYFVNVWPCNGSNPSYDSEYQEYKRIVKEDVERVRDKVDLLIVAMHWGVEYTHTPTAYQIDMANYLESLGVNIIIGTHAGKKLTAEQIAEVVDCVKVSRSANVVISKEDLALLGDKYIVK